MFKNISPDSVRSGRTCPENLGVRSFPVRKLICPVRLNLIYMALDNSVGNNFSLFQFKSSQEVTKKAAHGKKNHKDAKTLYFLINCNMIIFSFRNMTLRFVSCFLQSSDVCRVVLNCKEFPYKL